MSQAIPYTTPSVPAPPTPATPSAGGGAPVGPGEAQAVPLPTPTPAAPPGPASPESISVPILLSKFVGSIHQFPAAVTPAGFLPAEGQLVSVASYPSLYSVYGYTFGGSGGSFGLPDLRGKFLRSASANAEIGTTGGAVSATLSIGQIPQHTHQLYGSNSPADSSDAAGSALAQSNNNTSIYRDGGVANQPMGTSSIGTAGSASPTPVPTLPPYFSVRAFVYAGVA